MLQIYVVEDKNGDWRTWKSRWLPFLGHRPQVEDGGVILDDKWYSLNPGRMRRLEQRRLRSLFLLPVEYRVQLWRENDPEPVPLLEPHNPDDDRTGEKIALLARQKKLSLLTKHPDVLLMALLVIVGFVTGLVFGQSGALGGP